MSQLEENQEISSSLSTRIVSAFLNSNFSVLLILMCVAMGSVALLATPREEDPQVIVPFVDIFVETPGVSALETRTLAAEPLERLLIEIPGVEHVYSTSWPDRAMVTVRFEVGEDREKALLNVYNKLRSNKDRVPPQVQNWIIKPVEIDDVPVLALTLYSSEGGDDTLVRYADELAARLQKVDNLGRVQVHGGQRRQVRIQLDPVRLRARNLSAIAVMQALGGSNRNARTGSLEEPGRVKVVEVGPFLETAQDLESLVISMADGHPIFLRDVAQVLDGPREPDSYTRVIFGPAAAAVDVGDKVQPADIDGRFRSAVTISIAKRKGTNAVVVAQSALEEFQTLHRELRPAGVKYLATRNYGVTANEKVNELVGHLLIAVGTIVVLVGASLGWRSAFVVALAVPLTLAITLFADLLVGYTINRVTLFALILSLGLIVDDPIVDVENIHRHLSMGKRPPKQATLRAVDEVRPPVILATLAVMMSFLPMFFVSGMMGPYMAPMPFNVPVAMFLSLVVAFTVTPWATYHLLKNHVKPGTHKDENQIEGRFLLAYARVSRFFVESRVRTYAMLTVVTLAFFGSVGMAAFGMVPLKMLPFDNKSEFQVLVNGPEGMPLESTDRAIAALARELVKTSEVTDVTSYTGHASPHDFNGMVRHYFLRKGGNLGDLRVNLLPRHERGEQAHTIALAIRPALEAVAAEHGVRIALVEPPPGPPVLASVVAEVYSPLDGTPEELVEVARDMERRFEALPYVRDVDTYMETSREKWKFTVDRQKAALRGVSPSDVVDTLGLALSGFDAGVLHVDGERQPLPIRLELARADRSTQNDLLGLSVPSRANGGSMGGQISLSDLISTRTEAEAPVLYRKDLKDVQYVTGEAVGKSPVDAVFALQADLRENPLPAGYRVEFAGEGEWQVTVDVFIDMGIAFAAALAGIYILLVAQTGSFLLSALMMLAIPLTMIGVFPGFWILNKLMASDVGAYENPIFFTATGMIGLIALAGIVVRNSIILIDFIEQNVKRGMPVKEACVLAGAVRLRPIALTAAAAVMGAWVIVFDPIFSGLAWSFVFGIIASTFFTLLVVPAAYALVKGDGNDELDPDEQWLLEHPEVAAAMEADSPVEDGE